MGVILFFGFCALIITVSFIYLFFAFRHHYRVSQNEKALKRRLEASSPSQN